MFPEITRDDVFRIETPRLWLRWPSTTDADALAAVMAQTCTTEGAKVAQVNVPALQVLIAAWRDDMEAGRALHLVVTLKREGGRPIGVIHTGADRSCIAADHRALGDEAATGLRQMTALFGLPPPPRRTPPMAQQRVFPAAAVLAGCCLQA